MEGQRLTPTEADILLGLTSLEESGRESYGVSIRIEVERITGRRIPFQTLHSALDVFEEEELVEKDPRTTSKRRRAVMLSSKGRAALQVHLEELEHLLRVAGRIGRRNDYAL